MAINENIEINKNGVVLKNTNGQVITIDFDVISFSKINRDLREQYGLQEDLIYIEWRKEEKQRNE